MLSINVSGVSSREEKKLFTLRDSTDTKQIGINQPQLCWKLQKVFLTIRAVKYYLVGIGRNKTTVILTLEHDVFMNEIRDYVIILHIQGLVP